MERTPIQNYRDEEGPIENWKKSIRGVKLKCPKCLHWFLLDKKTFKVDPDGNVSDVVYHICDAGDEDDSQGWVVLPQLIGWRG